jgi:ribosomal protein L37E
VSHAAPALIQGWKDQGAVEWRCRRCPRILGYVLGREMRIPLGGVAVQVCERCGQENRYDPACGAILDA